MEVSRSSISLKDELEGLIQTKDCGKIITCFGKPVKGGQCRKPLSRATHTNLTITLKTIIEHFEEADYGIEASLEKATLLAMCRYHKGQAAAKFKQWSDRTLARTSKLAHGGGNVEVSSTLKHIVHTRELYIN